MTKNFNTLVLLLVVCAVGGSLLRNSKREDLRREKPWANPTGNPHQELRRRQLQKWLDQTVGAENGLVLMNVGAAPIFSAEPGPSRCSLSTAACQGSKGSKKSPGASIRT